MSDRRKTKPKIPLIKCLPRLDFMGGMMFWCPFCKRWHYHGRHNGYRGPHCVKKEENPFLKNSIGNDYEIKMMSIKDLREIRKAITEYLQWIKKRRKLTITRGGFNSER